jgi:hypothetical protein
MKKILENLNEAKKNIQTIDHMIYMTFPIVRENKFLLNILSKNSKVLKKLINSLLHYEYVYKRIKLYNNPEKNFQTFENKVSKRYNFTVEEIKEIKEILQLAKKHKESSVEFPRKNKVVILSENMEKQIIDLDMIKKQINLLKRVFKKIEKKFT